MQENKREFYRSFYDQKSAYWDSVYKNEPEKLTIFALHFRQRRKILLNMIEELPKKTGVKSLDAGCGPGAYIQPFLNMGYEVSAIDQSDGMIEQAKENFSEEYKDRVTLKVSGIESIPFSDESFDLITNVAVLMYVPDEIKAIKEFYRVMKPGGTLIITVDNKKDLSDIIDIPLRIQGLFRRISGSVSQSNENNSGSDEKKIEPKLFSPSEMVSLLKSAGFVIDEQTSMGFAPFKLNQKRIFSDNVDIFLDKMLQFLRYIPVIRLTGYTYICRCHKPK